MPQHSEFSDNLVADDAFRVGSAEGLIAAPDAPDARFEFFDAIRSSVLASFETGPELTPDVGLFVRALRPREAALKFGSPTVVRDLDLRPASQWQGRLVFAAQHGTGGWSVPILGGDLNQCITNLIDMGFGDEPAAVVYPHRKVISCSLDGLASTGASLKLTLPRYTRQLSLQDIKEVIGIIRSEGLLTPAVCPPNLWSDPANYVPSTETERLLQWCVASEMRAHFRPIIAEREQITAVGRIDICLTNPLEAQGAARYPAIVELKALRSRTSGGISVSERSNLASIIGGLRQAKAYRKKKEAGLGVLTCFDLRKDKTDLLAHETVVRARSRYEDSSLSVLMMPLYGDPQDAQEELAAE